MCEVHTRLEELILILREQFPFYVGFIEDSQFFFKLSEQESE